LREGECQPQKQREPTASTEKNLNGLTVALTPSNNGGANMNSIVSEAKDTLMKQRAQLQRLYAQNIAEEQRLRGHREADWPDQAASEESLKLLSRLSDREREELQEIEAAMRRIEAGSFGRCERCSGSIGRQRLRAVPEARFCLECESLRP
jgi:DnaK suppressor protein